MCSSKVAQAQPACLDSCSCQTESPPHGAAFWLLLGCLLATAGWALASRTAQQQRRRHRQLQTAAAEDWDEFALRRLFQENLPPWVCCAYVWWQWAASTSHATTGRPAAHLSLCSWLTPRWCGSQSG